MAVHPSFELGGTGGETADSHKDPLSDNTTGSLSGKRIGSPRAICIWPKIFVRRPSAAPGRGGPRSLATRRRRPGCYVRRLISRSLGGDGIAVNTWLEVTGVSTEERVTGMEPAWSAWKNPPGHPRSCIRVRRRRSVRYGLHWYPPRSGTFQPLRAREGHGGRSPGPSESWRLTGWQIRRRGLADRQRGPSGSLTYYPRNHSPNPLGITHSCYTS